ncbi:XRE family transcriptional regulator [Microseira wollei]|uniref:Transcriptional Regulator, XRE family protein n=1 Tax=Microseira wollei NIES-4236 TaxID=2530354 RepID=A0AAV3XQ45_9CYAN|nr:XRE family transcriptional regulator [Microseira wollei]GET42355.1 transcriptional Regulator, XRE family protein [Microseira wollei NIES-4236]
MRLIRLRVRELAGEKGWTLKEVSERSGPPHSPKLATVDYTALKKLAYTFDVIIDDLVEILEE